ncbi:thiamine-phosphate kinase [Natronosalvus rutilus]|uniref:Thiamine-monophosphate kinase n=1 Tax=Natronosalvus rutilus TaxID=2953753 RepID=A0A9E7SW14_9EURY|nr:thiamine-phosphate kinase [Natronosalvus rutilus]UTF54582.1 thiamine-phosphate kinase [Natronosalvus rutilus]
MDERAALALLENRLDPVGDDAAVVNDLVITTDMLHETTDFPPGTTRYTAGWRAVGASLSDVAAMGAEATAAVAAYAAPDFDAAALEAFVDGAIAVCALVDAKYVGGDLDTHQEFTVATTAVGRADEPVFRDGASPGDVVCVTGTLGRTVAALELFEVGKDERNGDEGRDSRDEDSAEEGNSVLERANDLFQFEPRVRAGRVLAPHASAMMDSSDGLARSLHQLAEASGCGFALERESIPVAPELEAVVDDHETALERAITTGEDFELVCTLPEAAVERVRGELECPLAVVGRVVDADAGVSLDDEALVDRGYTHGE